jgi:uncharacterized membrane-anchored protein YjiN (DUF445 family)
MLKFMEKLAELKRAKLLALSLLLIAAALFITTLLLPPTPWVSALKAISEAAMVGALADWFAVVACFAVFRCPLSPAIRRLSRATKTASPIISAALSRRSSSIPRRWSR